jgi:ribosomal-protein-serine acetyltransferase
MIDHAFGELGFNRVEIRAASENLRSRAIPERLSFTQEGVVRRSPEWQELDSVVYGMLSDEWDGGGRGAARFRMAAGDGIELRLLEQRHSEELFGLVGKNRGRLSRWFQWAGETKAVEDTRKFIEGSLEKRADGRGYQAGIWAGGRLAGVVGYARLDRTGNWGEIGYWLDGDFEGHGIMTRACRAVLDDAFTRRGLKSVQVRVADGNGRSQRLAERLGFRKEAVIRKAERLPGGHADVLVYGMLASEWAGGGSQSQCGG